MNTESEGQKPPPESEKSGSQCPHNMNSIVAISESDGKSLLENSEIESFYERLYKLHDSSGLNLVFDFRQTTLDLHLFFKEVTQRGGFIQVTTDGRWGEVALALKLDGDHLQDPQPLLKLYALFLYQYEQLYHFREPRVKAASSFGHAFIGNRSAVTGNGMDNSPQIPNLEDALVKEKKKKMSEGNCQPTMIGSTSAEQKQSPKLRPKNKGMKKPCGPTRGAPRGTRSAYSIFIKEECERLKSTTDAEKLMGHSIRYMANQAWRSLSENEKQPYIEASKKIKEERLAADEENRPADKENHPADVQKHPADEENSPADEDNDQDMQDADMAYKFCVENQPSIAFPDEIIGKIDE